MNNETSKDKNIKKKKNKVDFWITLWLELIDNFNKNSYGLKLINPQLILLSIIDEIESSQLNNKEIKKYYLEQLGQFIKNDPSIINKFKTDFTLIINALQNNRMFYLQNLCKEVQKIFHSGKYFNELYNSLKKILLNKIWEKDDNFKIRLISQHLITELLLKGYKLDDIQKFPRNLFDKYRKVGKYLLTDFPLNTDINNYVENDNVDIEKYNFALKIEIDNLSLSKRLDYFPKYFSEKKTKYFIIHQIHGIRGENIDFKIGKTNFYSPTIKQITKYSDEKLNYIRITGKDVFNKENPELFKSQPENKLINIVIEIKAINVKSASIQANKLINRSLDFIRCFYKSKVPFKIIDHQIVLNSKKQEISFSFSPYSNLDLSNYYDFLELSSNPNGYITTILKVINKFIHKPIFELNDIEKKIIKAMHWYRKANECNNLEEKLLNYWIIIENFVNVELQLNNSINFDNKTNQLSLIQKIISSINILIHKNSYGWELYHFIIFMNLNNPTIPNDLVKNCYLTPSAGTSISLRNFLRHFPKLKKYANSKVLADKINTVEDYYYKPKESIKLIDEKIKIIKEDIMMIYRLRNKIVHNAHYQDVMLEFYVTKAETYSKQLLHTIINGYCFKEIESIDCILMSRYVEFTRLMKNIEVNNTRLIDLL